MGLGVWNAKRNESMGSTHTKLNQSFHIVNPFLISFLGPICLAMCESNQIIQYSLNRLNTSKETRHILIHTDQIIHGEGRLLPMHA